MDEVDGAPKGDACPDASETCACAPNADAPPKPDMSYPTAYAASLLSLPNGLLNQQGDVEALVAGCRRGVVRWDAARTLWSKVSR